MNHPRIVGLTLAALCSFTAVVGAQGVVPAAATPLDQPILWLKDAKRNYGAVKDYTCTLVSQERVKGKLGDENYIDFKQRTAPFSVSLRWLAPVASQNQHVIYVDGRNNNKMRVKSNKLVVKNVWISLDVNDPRVNEHSRHTIREAGIGNMIDTALNAWEAERKFNKTDVKIAEAKFDDRACYRVELTRTAQLPQSCYRTVMYLEKESKIPVRVENYDYPRQGGPAGGELLELFSYTSLRFNVNLRDDEFNK